MENMTTDMINTVHGSWNKMANTAEAAGNTVKGAISNGYEAAKTSASETVDNINSGFLGMDSSMWIWVILALTMIAVFALVWYYTIQTTDEKKDK